MPRENHDTNLHQDSFIIHSFRTLMDQIIEQKIRDRELDQACNEQHEDYHAQFL